MVNNAKKSRVHGALAAQIEGNAVIGNDLLFTLVIESPPSGER